MCPRCTEFELSSFINLYEHERVFFMASLFSSAFPSCNYTVFDTNQAFGRGPVIITSQYNVRKWFCAVRDSSAQNWLRNRPRKIRYIIARQFSTVAYGDFGLVYNMTIIPHENQGDKNTRF